MIPTYDNIGVNAEKIGYLLENKKRFFFSSKRTENICSAVGKVPKLEQQASSQKKRKKS